MPRNEQPELPRLWYMRYTAQFEAVDFSLPLQNPFDLTNHITTAMAEAGAKDSVVVVQVSLVPFDQFYPTEQEKPDENPEKTPGS
jgi:hypothetical protein